MLFLIERILKRVNNGEIIKKVHSSMYRQIKATGVATPVQVLMDIGVLSASDFAEWRFGRVDYLERVCKINLSKLSFIMKQIRDYAGKSGLKPSWTFYKRWGRKGKDAIKLRFSKYGDEAVERNYTTHYISQERIDERREHDKHKDVSKEEV